VTDDFPGESSGVASQGAYGPPARWATLVSPVAPESVVMVLSSSRQWRVKQLGSGFILFGAGRLEPLIAEAEVVSRSRRVTDEERAVFVQQIAKALRGREVAA